MAGTLAELVLTDDERQTLQTWASRPKSTNASPPGLKPSQRS